MQGMKLLAILVGCLCQLNSIALATDRYYADITTHSPTKRFRVDAKSPDNVGNGFKAFQKDFVYTFTDTETDTVLWTHHQKGSRRPQNLIREGQKNRARPEGSPVDIFVSDDGWTIVWTAYDDLVAFDPDGKIATWVGLLYEAMTREEVEKFVSQTTAGPMWASMSHWYFADIENHKAFVIRPWWGRRLFFNLETGELFEEQEELLPIAIELEKKYVKKIIENYKPTTEDTNVIWEAMGAAHLAGCLKLESAVPFLKKIEESDYSGTSAFGTFEYEVLTLRQHSQLALRRIGAKTTQPPPIRFIYDDKDLNGFEGDRSKWKEVKPGMSATEVYQLIGAPDFMRGAWSYDIVGERELTFEVSWTREKIVESVEQFEPKWNDGVLRDETVK